MTQPFPKQPTTETCNAPAPRWTPEKQGKFLEALARCGSVKAAAAFVGMSRESAHRLRRRSLGRDESRAFSRAWDAALIHARDIYAEEVLEKGLNGWAETVWYHGEEVGERQRVSVPLLLAALARLDAKADECDLAGNPVRVAAAEFDEMVEAISQGSDCAEMLAQQDQAAEPDIEPPFTDIGNDELMARLREQREREQIAATAPEDIDISDIDPDDAADWDDMQWERAMRSGMSDDPDFWTRVRVSEAAAGIVHDDDDFASFMPSDSIGAKGP